MKYSPLVTIINKKVNLCQYYKQKLTIFHLFNVIIPIYPSFNSKYLFLIVKCLILERDNLINIIYTLYKI